MGENHSSRVRGSARVTPAGKGIVPHGSAPWELWKDVFETLVAKQDPREAKLDEVKDRVRDEVLSETLPL